MSEERQGEWDEGSSGARGTSESRRTKEKEKTIRRTAEPEDEETARVEERWRRRRTEKDREEIGTGGGVITDCSP